MKRFVLSCLMATILLSVGCTAPEGGFTIHLRNSQYYRHGPEHHPKHYGRFYHQFWYNGGHHEYWCEHHLTSGGSYHHWRRCH